MWGFDMRAVVLCCLSAVVLSAQEPYGRITGRVVDSGGAVVPGASLRVTNTETRVETNASSDSAGAYEARNLIPGRYTITAETKGFKRYLRGPVEVRVGDVLTIDITLELGAVSESVTVTAEAPLLEAASGSLGQVVDRKRLLDLPMPSSNPMYLTQLSPGVMQATPPSGNWQINQNGNISNFSTNGTATQTSEFTIDGVPNMQAYGLIDYQPMPEVLQEFRVETAPFDASVGHFTGSQVNMVIKSGTNALHGSVTYEHNNRPLNSVPFFANSQIHNLGTGPVTQVKINAAFPPTRINRSRGVVSGPVDIPKLYDGHNRTFFTYGLDDFARVFVPNVTSKTVPTAAERGGDFSALLKLGGQYQIYDPATIAPAGNGRFSRAPLAGNVIPSSRISPVAATLLGYYPLPNGAGSADGLNNYTGSPVNRPKSQEHLARIDHMIDPNHRLSVSVVHQQNDSIQQSSGFPSDYLGVHGTQPGMIVTVDSVTTFRPDLVLDVRVGLSRLKSQTLAASSGFDLKALGLQGSLVDQLDRSLTPLPQLNFGADAFSTIGNATGSITQTNYEFLAGDVAHNRGNHSLRFGGELRIYELNSTNYGFVSPSYTFSTDWTRGPVDNSPSATVGQGLASLLFGLPTTGQSDRNASLAQASKYVALFLQDDWKVSRRLTVNAGLRYEVELPTTERFNRANRGFDFSAANPIQAAAYFPSTGGLLFAGVNGVPRGLWNTDAHLFMPRVGLAYQLAPSTVARAGYGIFFESLGADRYNAPQQGFSKSTLMVPSLDNGQTFQATLANPFPNGLLSPSGSSSGLETLLGQPLNIFWPDRRPGCAQRWTANLQRELPGRVLVEVGYVGNRGTGLSSTQDLDSIPVQYLSQSPARDQNTINYLTAAVPNPFYGLAPFAGSSLQGQTVPRSQLLLPYPEFAGLSTTLSDGISWYHALQARAEKRLSHDLTIQGSYTWSKFMEAIAKLNPTDAHPAHSISTLDRPQYIVVSGIYALPLGKGKRFLTAAPRWLDEIAGGWQIQAIYQAQSGAPVAFGNIIFNGDIHDIPLDRSRRTLGEWFNVNAGFNRNPQQQLASNVRTFPLALAGVRADGVNNWDLALYKSFPVTERVSFQLRAEAQDALNHPQFSPPNTSPTSTLFGQVTTTVIAQQRVVTVGARLMW
jgi:hypothetical protein